MNLYEILQNSGRVGEGMTHFERLFAQKVGGGKINEISGVPPLRYIGNGRPLTDYTIYGNTVQNGTPSPEAPVDVVGCGEKTKNVMPAGEQKTVEVNGITISSDGNGRYTIRGTATAYASARFNLLSAFTTPISVSNGGQGTLSFFNTQTSFDVAFIFYNGTTKIDDWKQTPIRRVSTVYNAVGNKYVDSVEITVNSGATVDMTITPEFTNNGVLPASFEPYGYKLPLTVNGTEHPIYLGQVETTRQIKKLVLTGEEDYTWYKSASRNYSWYIFPNTIGTIANTPFYCSHGETATNVSDYVYGKVYCDNTCNLGIFDSSINSTTKLNNYFAQQYTAGTPVTIWYVLAEPETGVVNEPLHKIGNYADTISFAQSGVTIPTINGENVLTVPTTVPPSEVWIRGKIKEV